MCFRVRRFWFAVIATLWAAAACGASHRLADQDFRDRTVSVVSDIPSRPDVLAGPAFLGGLSGNPIRDALRVGARVYREVEARNLRERLDSAAVLVDVGHVLEDHTLERAARYLGTRPVADGREGDFLLELIIHEYGIDADGWDAAAHFFIEAEATLISAATGDEIWRSEIGAREAIGPRVFGPGRTVRDVVTAASLADLSAEEMAAALESLAEFSARIITDELRDDLRDVRRN